VFSLAALVGFSAIAHAQTVGKWHRHVVSITGSVSGNPFEAVVDGEFTHSSGIRIKLPGYYDGNRTWRFGFMPTKIGTWTWRTVSSEGSLDGETGSLTVVESGHPGLLRADPAHPRKWKYEDGPYVVPIGAFVNAMLDNASDSQFPQMADFLENNGFQLINFRISEHDRAFSNVSRREMHLDRWRRLERRMEMLSARGLGAEVMLYTDDAGTPSFHPKSVTERLLIRYMVARLAGYPIVLFNSGIDIGEYRTGDWATWYGQQVRSQEPYGHPVSSRFKVASNWPRMNGETYTSDGGRNSKLSSMLDAYNRKSIPAINTDNFSEDLRNNVNAHTRDDIRRAAWKGVVVGGVGFHIRDKDMFCPSGITECDRYFRVTEVAQSLHAAPWIRLVNPFVQSRLGSTFGTMTYAVSLVGNGHALADPDRTKIMYLVVGRHDTWDTYDDGSLTVKLGGLSGAYATTWFDPRTGQETSAGTLAAGKDYSMTPPSDPSNDWILLLEERSSSGSDRGGTADKPLSMQWPILARSLRERMSRPKCTSTKRDRTASDSKPISAPFPSGHSVSSVG
jgi:hypothetical protein